LRLQRERRYEEAKGEREEGKRDAEDNLII
jgi:hypothetical protein